ncbi:hypothetical protein F5Y17DRAFT_223428 [Xylariaceae sp. FL0594]|nr:hypothetical protein F5Y17DRAFT_223428 [Xylariaceae sp. FL0594]
MATYNGHRPYTASEIHLALLRPAILQILRAQGYYASTPRTIDCLTELAGHYIYIISKRAAQHATLNNYMGPPGTPEVVDVRMALEECGALCPSSSAPPPPPRPPPPTSPRRRRSRRDSSRRRSQPENHDDGSSALEEGEEEGDSSGIVCWDELEAVEDTRGVDEFIRWAMGRKNQRIRKVAGVVAPPSVIAADVEGEEGMSEEVRPTDYLDALKRKHNKTDQDSKYAGTILGRPIDHGEVPIEGGSDTSLAAWAARMRAANLCPPDPDALKRGRDAAQNGSDSRPPSSGLSSLADEDVAMTDF